MRDCTVPSQSPAVAPAPVVGASYRVGIHYYDDDICNCATSVTVRIYCGDIATTPVATYTRNLTQLFLVKNLLCHRPGRLAMISTAHAPATPDAREGRTA